MIPIKYRRFAIRPRLAYFRRVRSPRCRRRGMFAPTDSFPGSAPAQLRDAGPRGRHVVAEENHPALPEGSVHFGGEKKDSLRGDEYRPRARARACVYHAHSLPESFSKRRLCRLASCRGLLKMSNSAKGCENERKTNGSRMKRRKEKRCCVRTILF